MGTDINKIMVVSGGVVGYSNFLQPLKDRYGKEIIDTMGYFGPADYKIKRAEKYNKIIDLLIIDPIAPP